MEKQTAISVRGLGKVYSIKKPKKNLMFRDAIFESAQDLYKRVTDRSYIPPSNLKKTPFWAIRDVDMDVQMGESVGIIGANGAGKSTLLKLLTRITAPSEGEFTIRGRVGSLLEVGTGFHTELTGRENVYLNGVILGMRKKEIDRKYDEIVEFAEVEDFMETQVKHYSSGMKMRLAFSVAAHLDPDVLLVDEVLAVGDISFQRKSLDKMGSVISGGKTVLFVSHNIAAVRALCTKAVYLDKGRIVSMGDIDTVTREYMNSRSQVDAVSQIDTIKKKYDAQILSAIYLDEHGKPEHTFAENQPFSIILKTYVAERLQNAIMSLKVFNSELDVVFESNDFENDEELLVMREPGIHIRQLNIPANLLSPGQYYLGVAVSRRKNMSNLHTIQKVDHVAPFEIFDSGSAMARNGVAYHGLVHPNIVWNPVDQKDFDTLVKKYGLE